jgi:zinc-ribbon domain
MGVCVDDVLASVREVVDLPPHEALDEAQDFLTRQGYSVTYRTTTTLSVKRQVSDNATGQESIFKLIVMALPQSRGGVRIMVRGNDREAVRDHQAAWLEWSETLPKRETEQPEAAATMESDTREIVGQEAPRHTTAADNDVPQSRYCSNCGHELSEDAQFCSTCGRPVHQTARVPTPEAEVPVPPPPPQQDLPAQGVVRLLRGMPREVPIGVSYEQAIEELDQFFALDFQTNRDCTLRYFDDGIRAIERTQSSPLLLVIHLALTLFTFGFWLIVWFVVATVRASNRQKVRVRLIQEEDKITAELSGSDSWVQTTEAFIRRNLKGAR